MNVRDHIHSVGVAGCLCLSLLAAAVLVVPRSAYAGAVENLPGFTTTSFLANDDGTYPQNGLGAGNPGGPVSLVSTGFSMNFYGVTFNSVYVNNNGNVTLDAPLSTFTPFGLASTGVKIIAPFFGDVDTRVGNIVTFGTDLVGGHSAFGVDWPGVGYYSEHTDKLNNFQLILVDRSDAGAGDFDIIFNYDSMQWETGDASGGSNGLGGTPAAVGFSNGGANTFQLAGSLVSGALIDGGPNALISHSFNSDVLGRYVFEVRNGAVITPTVPESASLLTVALSALALLGFARFARRK